jgi:hypothetical protein
MYQPDPDYTATFGFPFLHLSWHSNESWSKDLRLTLFGGKFLMRHPLKDDFEFITFAEYTYRSYCYSDRTDDEDRLFYQEAAVEVALKKNLTVTTGVIFSLGYSFDRHVFENEDVYAPNTAKTSIEPDFYGRIHLEFRL